MLEELQSIVDRVARALDREVAVDDLAFHLLAYSSHNGVVDSVRAAVVLTREAPAEAAAWVRTFPIQSATAPVRIPANEHLGLLPRVCIALRAESLHFGWLWLIDPDESLTTQQLSPAVAAAEEAAQLLHRNNVSKEYIHARERELLRDLISEDDAVCGLAARQLIEEGRFTSNPDITVIVLRPFVGRTSAVSDEVRSGLAGALDEAQRLLPSRECLRLVRPDHAVLVTRTEQVLRRPDLLASLTHLSERPGMDCGVGLSRVEELAEVARAYVEARLAAHVAEVVPTFRPVARYEELGVYALLAAMPLEQLGANAVHPAVRRLAAQHPELLSTLEAFLDRAGDTRAVAVELRMHRSTVYYRLGRVQEITGLRLEDGEHRLALHLGLKILRLRPELGKTRT